MNPYQVMGVIAGCTLVFVGVVSFLAMHGVPVLLAFLSVYLVAVWSMLGMQKRARQTYDGMRYLKQRRHDDELLQSAVSDDLNETGKAITSPVQYQF